MAITISGQLNLKPYPEYIESGLPWLDQIPANWGLIRAKWLFRKMDRPVRPDDEVITCFRDGTVTLRKNRRLRGFTESLKEIGYQGIRHGDLVIHQMDGFAGAIGVSDSDGKGSPIYSVCEPIIPLNAYYYAQVLREMARSQYIVALARGIRERSSDFRFETFSAQYLPIPPLEEQNFIVNFVNHVDQHVRRYIRAKRRQIELLDEQKQAIIHQAVTRGVNPHTRLKRSGLEWLGDIPEHWEIKRIKQISFLKSGENITSLDFSDDGPFPVFGGNGLRGFASSYTHDGEFVLIGRQGALCGNINYANGKFWASEHAVVAFPLEKFSLLWFGELLRSMNLNQYSISAAQPGLSVERIKNLKIPIPQYSEQQIISKYIEENTNDLSLAVSKSQNQIGLIREYRNRMISDVVTGKLDVSGVDITSLQEDEPIEPMAEIEDVSEGELTGESEIEGFEEVANADN